MRPLTTLAIVLIASTTAAADPPKPLSRQEAAEGWLQLFDGESLFGWSVAGNGEWTVANGALTPKGANPAALVSNSEFAAFELKVEYKAGKDARGEIRFWADAEGDADKGFGQVMKYRGDGWTEYYGRAEGKSLRTEYRSLPPAPPGNKEAVTWDVTKGPMRGRVAFSGSGIDIRSIKVRPLDVAPLFNGKDLAGWKVFPGEKYKSVFAVKDGTINVKNGPGDLQTEGQWADFVLQLECVSNGKHLNSGVFFRALPDQYQQGYEAQIRNEFTDQPIQEYTLDVFDPKTNELKEKVKQKFTAVDFGTGAIYRRQPARKGVAKDGEWFTMTVMANGRHLATWVDGVQVADWTDHRPMNANGRNGCRLEKGCISFQGHDPTTDLSFRHIRLAELPAGK